MIYGGFLLTSDQCRKDVKNLTLLNKTLFQRHFGIVSTSFRRVEKSPHLAEKSQIFGTAPICGEILPNVWRHNS